MNYVENYYNNYEEENRLLSRWGSIEYTTTMQFIHKYVNLGARVLEVGAGTGRYSIALSREGYQVNAVELVPRNIDVFRSKLLPGDTVTVEQGTALDLTRFEDHVFDAVLVLGPMYHLFNEKDKLQALAEAKRVCREDGVIMIAYCMNEASVVQSLFVGGLLEQEMEKGHVTEDFHLVGDPSEIFELYRLEDIDRLNQQSGLHRKEIVATDLFTNYMRDSVSSWTEAVFEQYKKYHRAICTRPELIGVSHHTLDIVGERACVQSI